MLLALHCTYALHKYKCLYVHVRRYKCRVLQLMESQSGRAGCLSRLGFWIPGKGRKVSRYCPFPSLCSSAAQQRPQTMEERGVRSKDKLRQ